MSKYYSTIFCRTWMKLSHPPECQTTFRETKHCNDSKLELAKILATMLLLGSCGSRTIRTISRSIERTGKDAKKQ